MNRSAKQDVLAHYPNAYCRQTKGAASRHRYKIWPGVFGDCLGHGATKRAAWQNARAYVLTLLLTK